MAAKRKRKPNPITIDAPSDSPPPAPLRMSATVLPPPPIMVDATAGYVKIPGLSLEIVEVLGAFGGLYASLQRAGAFEALRRARRRR